MDRDAGMAGTAISTASDLPGKIQTKARRDQIAPIKGTIEKKMDKLIDTSI